VDWQEMKEMETKNDPPLVIGIAGGTGSGKTTVANHLLENIGLESVVHIQHDSYYKDLSHLSYEERTHLNYDHPDLLDNDLLYQQMRELISGSPVMMPVYDFKQYNRHPQPVYVKPRPVILVDGILIFNDERLRSLMDLKIFVDTDADLRFIRRLRRDINERGRSVESVVEQYLTTVRLMHMEFVEPTKRYADLIIPEGGYNVPLLLDKIVRLVQRLRQIDGMPVVDRREFYAGTEGH
jgi:uridine kinase